MKALIICTPRTRSSYLQDIVSKHYHIQNFWEPYNLLKDISSKLLYLKEDVAFQRYKNTLLDITKSLSEQNNFVIKIMPAFMHYSTYYHIVNNSNFDIKLDYIFDLEKYHNISYFDHIYVLHRPIVEWLISFYFARTRGEFLFQKKQKNLAESLVPKTKIRLNINYKIIKANVIDDFVMAYQEKWLIKNNFTFTKISYDDVPKFVAENFSNVNSDLLDTNYNYKNMIADYDEIEENIIKAKKELRYDELLAELFP